MSNVEVRTIPNTKKGVKEFVLFAEKVYKGNEYWVAPIYADQIKFIQGGVFAHMGEKELYMAYRDGKPVARVSVHRSFAHNEHYNTNQGFFGFFEAFDDQEAVDALFKTAFKWLSDKGCSNVLGPMSFTIYDQIGCLMDAYDSRPVVECTYNLDYYPKLLENAGFKKEIDWYAYLQDGEQGVPDFMNRVCDRVERNKRVVIRNVRKKDWEKEVESVRHIFNEAWAENWGNVPFSEEHWEHVVSELKLVLREDMAFICEYDGEPVAFSVCVPDPNHALQKARGRLFPVGLFKILYNLYVKKSKMTRMVIMGVLQEYRMRGYDMALIRKTILNGLSNGLRWADCSLIVETNTRMIEGMDAIGGKRYKTWRIFKKEL